MSEKYTGEVVDIQDKYTVTVWYSGIRSIFDTKGCGQADSSLLL